MFANNQMIVNDDKCHLILSFPEENTAIPIEELSIKCSKVKKLLRIHVDYKLKFNTDVGTIFKKAHRTFTALSRITNYTELPKIHILMNAFFKAQFNDCPIIWMFQSCSLNSKIDGLHKRCLRIIHNDKYSDIEKFINKDNFSLYTL